MSGACLLFGHLGQGRASHFLGLPGVSGVGQPLHGEHLAHLKGFCSGSWDWRMSGDPGHRRPSVQASTSSFGSAPSTLPSATIIPVPWILEENDPKSGGTD